MELDLAVVPVAGRGTSLLPATKSQPKEMLPVGRKPVVQYVVEELVACGTRRLLFVTGAGKTSIENHFDINEELIQYLRLQGKEDLLAELDFERQELKYCYTRQHRPLGLGHAVLCAQPFAGNRPFVLALGDSILGLQTRSKIVAKMADVFRARNADVVIAFQRVPELDVVRFGIAQPESMADVFALKDIVEKPTVAEAPSNLAVAARYILPPEIFDVLHGMKPGSGGELQLTDALRQMIKDGAKVIGVVLGDDERRYDIGDFESYVEAFFEFALNDPQSGDYLQRLVQDLLLQRKDIADFTPRV